MSSTDRQNKLLIAEDWKRIYQSFKHPDFKHYDFDSLRRVMISYLKENYPEDFNDYIESSEYIALIDLIAFLGQNLSFRIDLNSRENFLDLAERRESILRLARLLSYNPKRNQCANGILKITGVSTTEEITSSNNINLQNKTIIWNDSTNKDWYEQFIRVINSALSVSNTIGTPLKSASINGIPTKQYQFNGSIDNLSTYSFKKNIKGTTANFEIVPLDISEKFIQESPPLPHKNLSFVHRDDGHGPSSNNTGFFCLFKQGSLNEGNFHVENPSTNQKISINSTNINNTDVWLYSLDENNNITDYWTKIDSIEGNNIIYNNVNNDTRKIYSVLTLENDKINLIFSDGEFGELPIGSFKVYYRVSKNQSLIIHPNSMNGVTITVPYISKRGIKEYITLTLSLKYTVDNASVSESNESIKSNAPSTYYTQNRLITGEDYQIGVNSISQNIIKTRTVNRISSGISRYHDLMDPTGKYSNTLLFGDDGILYKRYKNVIEKFKFQTTSDVEGILYNKIEPLLTSTDIINFYIDMFPRFSLEHIGIKWNKTNISTGHFNSNTGQPLSIKDSNLKYVKFNTLIKFIPPENHVFVDNKIVPDSGIEHSVNYIWAKIVHIQNDGVNTNHSNGHIILNKDIPEGAYVTEIITSLPNKLSDAAIYQLINQITSYRTFGMRYSREDNQWKIISQNNLDISDTFSISNQGDTTNQQQDNSWLILFKTSGGEYTIKYRTLEYVFESANQMKFYYDGTSRTYEKITENDTISILSMNKSPNNNKTLGTDQIWNIEKEYRDLSSYVNGKKVILSLIDKNKDGVIDDPDIFTNIVNEYVSPHNKIIFFKSTSTYGETNDFEYIPRDALDVEIIDSKNDLRNLRNYPDNQLFYFIKENILERFRKKTLTLHTEPNYIAHYGRDNIKYKYMHYASNNNRIDPGVSNIMDTFILTSNYDSEFRKWISGKISEKPLPPSSDFLYTNYSKDITNMKSISDDIIYHPVRYRVLFGDKADVKEKARFKVVKNNEIYINDNELKTNIIDLINKYFSMETWEFGETFYFSELATYIITELSPKILSFIIVPLQEDLNFGALFEIHCNPDEIFISDATVHDIDIIDKITSFNIKSAGNIMLDNQMAQNSIISSYN